MDNLDCMDEGDLMRFWFVNQNGRTARKLYPGVRGARRAVANLANYASNKATAMQCRARGDISGAEYYENICERIYRDIPTYARW